MAASVVGIMCGVLGGFVVLRNMSLIGDALSHAVLPGMVLGYVAAGTLGQWLLAGTMPLSEIHQEVATWMPYAYFIGSVLAALLAAVSITWIQNHVRTENDAAIGIVFTTMFAIGVMGISALGSVHVDLHDALFGNVLGVSDEDLWISISVALLIIAFVLLFYRQLFASTFQPVVAEAMGVHTRTLHYLLMLILSFAVVASIRMVGVILVVAMLVTPAATALLLTDRLPRVIVLAGVIGWVAAAAGVNLSILLNNIPPGPTIVVVSTLLYALAVIFAPKKGLLPKFFHRRSMGRKVL